MPTTISPPLRVTKVHIGAKEKEIHFIAPWNAAGVDGIRHEIPLADRYWNAKDKYWIISPRLDLLAKLIKLSHDHWGHEPTMMNMGSVPSWLKKAPAINIAPPLVAKPIPDVFPFFKKKPTPVAPPPLPKPPKKARTLYEILSIANTATTEEIKKGYRAQAIVLHPDKNAGDPNAASNFIELKEAYEKLSDPKKKKRYDAGLRIAGHLTATLTATPVPPVPPTPPPKQPYMTAAQQGTYAGPFRVPPIVHIDLSVPTPPAKAPEWCGRLAVRFRFKDGSIAEQGLTQKALDAVGANDSLKLCALTYFTQSPHNAIDERGKVFYL